MVFQENRMKLSCKIATIFLVFFFCLHNSNGQTREEDSLNGYALHVTHQDSSYLFQPMSGPKPQGGAGITTPASLVNKPAAKNSERVSYIDFTAVLKGELWTVKVSVKFGEFYDQGEKQIATYQIREGEKARVKELAQYGIEPLDVSVVRVKREPVIQPTVVNRTSSIAVLYVKTGPLPLPYKIQLKNMSDKEVQSLEIVTSNGRGNSVLKWPEKTWDYPLIGPWQEYRESMPSERVYKSLPESGYLSEQLQIIEINTVVFTDGTYEGKPYLAGSQRAAALGSKMQLDRILPLIENALDAADVNAALDQFKEDVSSLDEIVDPTSFEVLMQEFPTLNETQRNSMFNSVRGGLHKIKSYLLSRLADFERTSKQTANSSFKDWLLKEKELSERLRSKLP